MYANSIYKNFYTPNIQDLSVCTQKFQPQSAKFCPAFKGDVFILNRAVKPTVTKSKLPALFTNLCTKVKEKIFSLTPPKIIEREEGLANRCLADTIKQNFINSKIVLENIDCFDVKDFMQLTDQQKWLLRRGIKSPYTANQKYTISNDAEKYIKVAKSIKSQLEQRFPEGFSVVSVGSSPSVLCDILKLENVNVKYLPFSRRLGYLYEPYKKDFQKLYKDTGITEDFIKKEKNIVFLDYTFSGRCLEHIKSVTKDIYNNPKNTHFLSINKDLELDDEFVDCYLKTSDNGAFSFVSPLANVEMMKQYVSKKAVFKPSPAAKLMRFALLDKYGKIY